MKSIVAMADEAEERIPLDHSRDKVINSVVKRNWGRLDDGLKLDVLDELNRRNRERKERGEPLILPLPKVNQQTAVPRGSQLDLFADRQIF